MIEKLKNRLDRIKADHGHAVLQVEEESSRLSQIEQSLNDHKQASEIVQLVAQSVEEAVHSKIASVVTDCLESIFDDPYEFVIRFERKRNRSEAVLAFKRNGLEVDPMSAAGGGAVDVAVLALRIACLTLRKDLRQVIILDEPCKFLSRDLQPRVKQLLEELSKRLGIQFIVVTHMRTLTCGQVITVGDAQGEKR